MKCYKIDVIKSMLSYIYVKVPVIGKKNESN